MKQLTPLQQALVGLKELRSRLDAVTREPIAVVGIGCRFPSHAEDAAQFWEMLRKGVEGVREVPPDRWDIDALYDPDPNVPGKIYTRYGAFLDDVEMFDAGFFGIAPREAASMDPQQRLLLEVAWQSIEDAGYAPAQLAGSLTGVYIGISSIDYSLLHLSTTDASMIDAYFGTGVSHSVAPGRVSYVLGLKGPSIAVDTACSSSLVTVHLACQALRNKECDMALAGGVNLIFSPAGTIAFCQARMLAPDGHCKTFDAAADGYVRGEGCGIVVLKRLSDALRDGDRIRAVIRGSAINQDGASGGLTIPNGPAQEAVIRKALAVSGIEPAEVSYVETHGTGTPLGDPIEVGALVSALAEGRSADQPLVIGSVKTNVGHLEAAAGVAGLIKVVLSLENNQIPPHLHLKRRNPYISWKDLPIVIPTQCMEWPQGAARHIAGVSSFAFNGTNAHVVLEAAPATAAPQETLETSSVQRPLHVLCVSAKTETALKTLAGRYIEFLDKRADLPAGDICFSANAGRGHFSNRVCVTGQTAVQLREGLSRFARDEEGPGIQSGKARDSAAQPVAFLFTGQGSQYPGMGRRLYETQPAFRRLLNTCDEILRPVLGESLLSVMHSETGAARLQETAFAQPALFSLEIGLVELWKSWGIEPAVVIGHSVGEFAAAYAAGVFSLEDGLRLIAERGRLMSALPEGGGMTAVLAEPDSVTQAIRDFPNVAVAALNGPSNTVISGPLRELESIAARLAADDVGTQPLSVSHAFHSPLMQPMVNAFRQAAARVSYSPARIDIVSNTTGRIADPSELAQANYWCRHLLAPVRFADGVQSLSAAGYRTFVEAGPAPVLTGMGRMCLAEKSGLWLASLRRGRDDWEQILETAGSLYVAGIDLDWNGFDRDYPRRKVSLPFYPFQRERHGADAASRHKLRRIVSNGTTTDAHPLLGSRLRSALSDVQFEAELNAASPSYLADHRVYGQPIMPAAGYLEMASSAAEIWWCGCPCVIENVTILEPLPFPEDTGKVVQLVLKPAGTERAQFQIFSLEAAPHSWRLHAEGEATPARPEEDAAPSRAASIDAIALRCPQHVPVDMFYREMNAHGIEYGSAFQAISELRRGEGEALGVVRLAASIGGEAARYRAHPVLIDAALQVLAAAVPDEMRTQSGGFLPAGVGRFALSASGFTRGLAECTVYARIQASNDANTVRGDIQLLSAAGEIVGAIEGLMGRRITRTSRETGTAVDVGDWFYTVEWRPRPAVPAVETPPSPMLTAELLAVRGVAHANREGIQVYRDLVPALEEASVGYACAALKKLGFDFTVGYRFNVIDLAAELRIAKPHTRLFARICDMLQEAGIARPSGTGLEIIRTPTDTATDDAAQLIQKYPQCEAELTLFTQCARSLAGVLAGSTDPLQVLFPNGSTGLTEKFYQHSPAARLCNLLVADAVGSIVEQLPPTRKIRVLEVGAGTGGTTAFVLPRLPEDRTEYVFTDVSPLFTGRAESKFFKYEFVKYQLFDVEQRLAAQEVPERYFDVVIAANVLHATVDLREALENARRLLAPHGILVVLEGTDRQRWIDLIFGLTEGWWRFKDTGLRPAHPLLNTAVWQDVLSDAGFAAVETFPKSGTAAEVSGQAVIVARVDPSRIFSSRPGSGWLIFSDTAGVSDSLAVLLAPYGTVSMVHAADSYRKTGSLHFAINPEEPADYKRLIDEVSSNGPLLGVIHLWSLSRADQDAGCYSVLSLVQALASHAFQTQPGLWLITESAQAVKAGERVRNLAHSTIWGLGRVIALEHPELRCVRLDLDPDFSAPRKAHGIFDEILAGESEDQIGYRSDERYVARLEPKPVGNGGADPLRLGMASRGVLDNLALQPAERRSPGPGEIEIQVEAAGLNFLDVLNALGVLPFQIDTFGAECAGRVARVGEGVESFHTGDEVIAITPGSFSTFVTAHSALVASKPASMSFVEAATIPVAFFTAYYSLMDLARLSKGERVLIHAAAGGVGLAAVQIAKYAGAEIFATAGTVEKRAMLKELGVRHVMDSRTLEFADQIQAATNQEGVHVVLNCLAGDFIAKSLQVVSAGGRFIEIGKNQIWSAERVADFRKDITYRVYDMITHCQQDPVFVGTRLRQLVGLVEKGSFTPLASTVFPLHDAASAFRHMAQAKHTGKIVLTAAAPAAPLEFHQDRTYLITGGLGGLGLLVARWMVDKGARNVGLLARNVPPDVEERIRELTAQARVEILHADVSSREALDRALTHLAAVMPPLAGIIHSAGTLDDGILLQQSRDRFRTVMAPKVDGAWNLHTRTIHDDLDFFVLFSTAAAVIGSPGQGNHAAANAFLDALAHDRRAMGLPAISINWGPWSEIGAAAQREEQSRFSLRGMNSITPRLGLQALERLLRSLLPQAAVFPADWVRFLNQFPVHTAPPVFRELERRNSRLAVSTDANINAEALAKALKEAPATQRRDIVLAHVQEQALKVLGLAASRTIDPRQPLSELGMDSLMAVELRNRLGKMVGRNLPSTLLFDFPNLDSIVDFLAREILGLEAAAEAPAASQELTERSKMIDQLEELSDEEVETLLAKKLEAIGGGGSST